MKPQTIKKGDFLSVVMIGDKETITKWKKGPKLLQAAENLISPEVLVCKYNGKVYNKKDI